MPLNLTNSRALQERAHGLLPCGAQTLSKAGERFPGVYPGYLVRGQGAYVWDADGNRYVDYPLALGPVSLGYAYPAVNEAVAAQLAQGVSFSLDHPLTIEVAEQLCAMVPCAESVRWLKTGSDAVMAAVRLARTYTNREVVLVASNSYHGMHSWFQTKEERGKNGVPRCLSDRLVTYEFSDTASLESVFAAVEATGEQVAAVLVEPARTFEVTPKFLRAAKKLCEQRGAVLIYDEVVTGFRLARGGAQERYGVTPHLCALGKALANGMPLAAVVGNRDVMDAFNRCFISGTYAGEALSLAAAKETLRILRDEPVVEHCWRQGARLRSAFNGVMGSLGLPAHSDGIDVCSVQTFHSGDTAQDNLLKSLWLQETAKRGLLFGNIQYICYSHGDKELDYTVEQMGFAAETLRKAVESGDVAAYLEGAPIGAVGWPR